MVSSVLFVYVFMEIRVYIAALSHELLHMVTQKMSILLFFFCFAS